MTDTDYQDLYFQVADGLTLYARDYPGPEEDSPVVLCLHGLTRNSRDFAPIAPALARTHRVLVAEQRGRGLSEYDAHIERYQIQNYVGDMLQLLAQQGVTQCAVIGTSMGGLMSMVMNAMNPELFTHIVINDIGPVLAQAGLDRIKSYVGSASEFPDWAAAVEYTKKVNGSAFPDFTADQWRQFAGRICSERDGRVVLDYDTNLSKPMKDDEAAAVPVDLWPLFDGLKAKKVMLVRGGISDLLDAPTTDEMRARHPEMHYVEVPNVGHAPILDEPGVTDAIVDFING